jgi:hypothetical protein
LPPTLSATGTDRLPYSCQRLAANAGLRSLCIGEALDELKQRLREAVDVHPASSPPGVVPDVAHGSPTTYFYAMPDSSWSHRIYHERFNEPIAYRTSSGEPVEVDWPSIWHSLTGPEVDPEGTPPQIDTSAVNEDWTSYVKLLSGSPYAGGGPPSAADQAERAIQHLDAARTAYLAAQQAVWGGPAQAAIDDPYSPETLAEAASLTDQGDVELWLAQQDLLASSAAGAESQLNQAAIREAASALLAQLPPWDDNADAPAAGMPPVPPQLSDVASRIERFGPFEPLHRLDYAAAAVAALDRLFSEEGPRSHLVNDIPPWVVGATD